MVRVAPSILHRFSETGVFAMATLMQQIEKAFLYGSKVVSAVVEASDTKKKTKWVSEWEIGIVAKGFRRA